MNIDCIQTPDQLALQSEWADLSQFAEPPAIDHDRMFQYRQQRLRDAMKHADVDLLILLSPISLRYAIEYRNYALFQSHIPTNYLFFFREATPLLFNAYQQDNGEIKCRNGRAVSFFDGGNQLTSHAGLLASDIQQSLCSIGCDNGRVALEYVNPSIVQALAARNIDVVDGVNIVESARLIKSEDEINCMRWSMAVAEHGARKVEQCLKPGVTELQLWSLLNYTNCANNGDWHDGRALVSGPRTNPWYQEASPRPVQAGDLVGFDTDMVGPFGYFADLSRTLFCGPGKPNARQRQLYQYAYREIQHNLGLVRPGVTFSEFQRQAFEIEEEFQANAYTCLLHGVGMTDEYPRINPAFRGPTPYDGALEAGMVVCIESYVGAVNERDGIKLEQQVVVTENGYDLITQYPFNEALMS